MRALTVSVNYADLLDITLRQNVQHFEEVVVVTDSKDKATKDVCESVPKVKVYSTDVFYAKGATFNKGAAVEEAFDFMGRHGWICILDADIYITEHAPNIFEHIGDDVEFAGVKEKDLPITNQYLQKIKNYSLGQYSGFRDINQTIDSKYGIEFYNMGLMLMSNKLKKHLKGDTPEQFIRRPEFERFVNGEGQWRWSTDQTLLNYWIKKENIVTQDLSWKWNALFKAVQDDKLHEAYFIHFFLSNNLPQKGLEIPEIIQNLSSASKIKYGHK